MDTAAATSAAAAPPTVARKNIAPAMRRVGRALLFGHGIFAALAAFIALTAAAGAAYEALASRGDTSAYPPTGRLVDIGGYRLHLDCRGQGSPTVVMDAGLGSSSLDWSLVQPALAANTRVCSYDRAGMGWSDPGPDPRTPGRVADELSRLLGDAGIEGPYVLVGHSLAGKNIRLFAARHPSEVAGIVLVDARSEAIDMAATKAEFDGLSAAFEAQGALLSVARRLGVARLFGPALIGMPRVPDAIAEEMELQTTNAAAVAATVAEGKARAADDAELAAASLGDLPLVVLAAGQSLAGLPAWAAAQDAMAHLSTRGRVIVAQGSGHYVQLEQPDLVVDAVRSVLADLNN